MASPASETSAQHHDSSPFTSGFPAAAAGQEFLIRLHRMGDMPSAVEIRAHVDQSTQYRAEGLQWVAQEAGGGFSPGDTIPSLRVEGWRSIEPSAREAILSSYTMVPGYRAYGWRIDDTRATYFTHPDTICLDAAGKQLGIPRESYAGALSDSLSHYFFPDRETAVALIEAGLKEQGITPEISDSALSGEFGAYRTKSGKDTITHFPGLEGYAILKLRELGEIITATEKLSGILQVAIRFNDPLTVENTDITSGDGKLLFINSDAGGTSIGNFKCQRCPSPKNRIGVFDVQLSFDTMWVPIERHTPEFLMARIDDFVEMAKRGVRYSFSGSSGWVDAEIRTPRR